MARLHLGCGSKILLGYINTDIENWSGQCDYVVDARNLELFNDNSLDEVYSRQVLEHISPLDTMQALREWYRVLKPGGLVKISVPDLERVFQAWLIDKTIEENEAINNIYGRIFRGGKRYARRKHKTGFTFGRLSRLLREVGFKDIRRVEDERYIILVVEAVK